MKNIKDMNKENYFYLFPIDEMLIPSDNSKVYMNRYWIVYNNQLLQYKSTKAWQCNEHKQILEIALENNSIYENCSIEFYPFIYIKAI